MYVNNIKNIAISYVFCYRFRKCITMNDDGFFHRIKLFVQRKEAFNIDMRFKQH